MGPGGNIRAATTKNRGLALVVLAATGLAAAGVQRQRAAMRRNEQAQRSGSGGENYYVSVDRSGGGV